MNVELMGAWLKTSVGKSKVLMVKKDQMGSSIK